MNVTLVLPAFDMAASLGSRSRMKRGLLPPLGIGYVASCVEGRGHSVSLVDAQIMGLDTQETVDGILARDPGVVGLSVITAFARNAYAVAAELKARAPQIPVVMGGPHCSIVCREVPVECPAVDVVIPGEGEIPFADLVDRVDRGESIYDGQGLVFRNGDGEVIVTGRAPVVTNLDELPHPARHLYDPYPYRALPNQVRREPSTTAISSRGCSWGKCTFCFQSGEYSARYRRRSPENVVEELTDLVRERGFREIIFWDDTFAVNPRWIDSFCDLLDREKLDITWSCYGHMRAIRPRMLTRMARSGCYNLYYGFESGVQEILDLVKKGTTLQQIRDTVKMTRDAGIDVRGSFILGFPTETPEQSLETIKFACELNADWMMFFPFHLQPGTAIKQLALSDGYLAGSMESIHVPSFVPSAYRDRDQLDRMVRKAYLKYYLRPRFWGRTLWNMRRPQMVKHYFEAAKFWLELVTSSAKA